MSDPSQRIVILNPDSTEVILTDINDLYGFTGQLSHDFRHARLTEEMRSNLCSLMEHKVNAICKALGYYGALGQEMERRHAEFRRANQRIRELEQMLGSTRPLDGFGELLKHLSSELSVFWHEHGFNHVSDVHFGQWGAIHIKYGFTLDSMRYLSSTPVSDRMDLAVWLQEMRDAGYIIVKDGVGRENALLDCDHNRALLIGLLTTRYPSMHIHKWENLPLLKCADHPNGSHIFGLEATIRDVTDIPNPFDPGATVAEAGERT